MNLQVGAALWTPNVKPSGAGSKIELPVMDETLHDACLIFTQTPGRI